MSGGAVRVRAWLLDLNELPLAWSRSDVLAAPADGTIRVEFPPAPERVTVVGLTFDVEVAPGWAMNVRMPWGGRSGARALDSWGRVAPVTLAATETVAAVVDVFTPWLASS
jgi:hypothetical protein